MLDTLLNKIGLTRLSYYEELRRDYLQCLIDLEAGIQRLEELSCVHHKKQAD